MRQSPFHIQSETGKLLVETAIRGEAFRLARGRKARVVDAANGRVLADFTPGSDRVEIHVGGSRG